MVVCLPHRYEVQFLVQERKEGGRKEGRERERERKHMIASVYLFISGDKVNVVGPILTEPSVSHVLDQKV